MNMNDVEKVLGGKKVFSCMSDGNECKKKLYEGVAGPVAQYGAETLVWQ